MVFICARIHQRLVWDSYQKQVIERRHAASFITKDYKSRNTGCIVQMLQDLELPPLEDHHRQLCLTMLYKTASGLIEAISPIS